MSSKKAKDREGAKTRGAFDLSSFDIADPELPEEIADEALTSGGFPYDKRLKRKAYETEIEPLQIELLKLQSSIASRKERLVAVFEGRDAAGKGGAIARLTQHLNPRHAHIVALTKPTEAERGQWYFQRYVVQLPTAGDMVLFDRSWYNRAGVERVMGFCTPEEVTRFLAEVPELESLLVRDGIKLVKFFLSISRETQLKRFHTRHHDPLKRWKLTAIDLAAITKWDDYSRAQEEMFAATHTKAAPWTVVRANDKLRARLGVIRHVLSVCDYEGKDKKAVGAPDPKIVGSGGTFFKTG